MKLFQDDPLNPDAGALLRDGLLKHGNGLSPGQMYKNMLNEELRPDALVETIIQEFKSRQ